jgi:spore coat polysaccharide biosynthesis protein SpsF
MKVVACVIARTVSTRLPLKVLRELHDGLSMLDYLIQRIKLVKKIDEIYICTSVEPIDEILEDVARRNNVKIYRGSAEQVIERMLSVAKIERADVLLRITGDNPFTSFEYLDLQLEMMQEHALDYVRLIDVPLGATAEVMATQALIRCNDLMDPNVSEYLMLFIFDPTNFRCGVIKPVKEDWSSYSITVDTPDDLRRTHGVLRLHNGDVLRITLKEIVHVLQKHDLPATSIAPVGKVKLPFGKEVSFAEFKDDMNRRIAASVKLEL